MRHRQTPRDLENERILMRIAAGHFGLDWRKPPENKYQLDGCLLNGLDIKAWVEVKWYNKRDFVGLHVNKYTHGCHLAAATGLPFYFVFRLPGQNGLNEANMLLVHDGMEVQAGNRRMRWAGKKPVSREPLDDDREPIAMLDPPYQVIYQGRRKSAA